MVISSYPRTDARIQGIFGNRGNRVETVVETIGRSLETVETGLFFLKEQSILFP